MATATSDVDEIRRQMAQIRHDLHHDVQGVVAGAEAVTDWHRYLRSYPWVALGAAAAAGYLLVPRRHRPPEIQAIPVPAEPFIQPAASLTPEKPARGVVSMVWGLLGPVMVRAAQSYAVNHLESWIAQPHRQGSTMAAAGPAPRPQRPADPGHSAGT